MANTQQNHLKSVQLNDVTLHYTTSGEGAPLILIHGSLSDLRYWENQTPVLEKSFNVIAYSRRYNYPNTNTAIQNHSAIIEAEDLIGLMNKLKIEEAYILGHSYGAYTALWFALENPKRVKKLILAEPPIIRWLSDIEDDKEASDKFLTSVWAPMGNAFLQGGTNSGLEFTSQFFFNAPLDSIPKDVYTYFIRNAKEWKLLTTSSDAFPMIDYEKVRNLKIETLLLSGALNEGKMHDLIDARLSELLPDNKRVIIEKAGHEMFLENAEGTNKAILDFLAQQDEVV